MTNLTFWQRVKPYLLDGWLPLFVGVMLAAMVLVSHGTYTFYHYILPPLLAALATVVLAIGIPSLEWAAIFAPSTRWKLFYLAGLIVLVAMEALAQYYQGQAQFVTHINQAFPITSGIDIATFANEPRGRVLVVGYIAILSAVVLFFGFAATQRYKHIASSAHDTAHNSTIPFIATAPSYPTVTDELEPVIQPEREPEASPLAFTVPATRFPAFTTIVDGLTQARPRTLVDLAAHLAVTETTVRRHRDALIAAGVLVRTPDGYRKNGVMLIEEQ